MGTSRSPGTQKTPKGPVQGTSLVDTSSGLPIDVVERAGKKRLAVDAEISANIEQVTVDLDYSEDSVQIGDPNTNKTLKINVDGSIDANVIVDGYTGTDNAMAVGTSDGTLTGTKKVHKIDVQGNLQVKDPAAVTELQTISVKLDDLQFHGVSAGLKSSSQDITSVATQVTPVPLAHRNSLIVRNNGNRAVYFGDSTVTTATGYLKNPGEELVVNVSDNALVSLWAITTAGAPVNVRILELA